MKLQDDFSNIQEFETEIENKGFLYLYTNIRK